MVWHNTCVVFVVQLLLCLTLCDPMDCSTPGLPVPHNLRNLPKFMSMALVMPSSHLVLWCPLLLLPSIFPIIRTFSMSWLFATGDQNTGASASASVLPLSIQSWFPLRLTGLISLLSRRLSEVCSSNTVHRNQIFGTLPSLWSSSHKRLLRLGWPSVSSVAQLCPTLCDPMNRSTPGLPVHHHLLEFTQTHVHRVRDAIQPSHPRLSPSPPAPNPSQHQSLFQWVNSLHEVAKVLELQL